LSVKVGQRNGRLREVVMRRILVLGLSMVMGTSAAVVGLDAGRPDYVVDFPDDWVVEDLGVTGQPLRSADGSQQAAVTVLSRAYPERRTEECVVVDLSQVAEALSVLGVRERSTMDLVAIDVLGHGRHGTTSSGLGYRESWSSWFEGTAEDGESYALYSYVGEDTQPDLEGQWFALDCRADGTFHQDWRQIARTFEFAPPSDALTLSGPVVIGGRIESPQGGVALTVPDGWIAADLAHTDLRPKLGSVNAETRWLAEALDGPFGESIVDRAAAGQEVLLWAWRPTGGPYWLESCEVSVSTPAFGSIAELIEAGTAYVASEPELQPHHSWSQADLPAGEAARHDFGWSPTAAGSEYTLLDGSRSVTVSCQHTALAETDRDTSRGAWRAIAETLEFLSDE
jgi:hypothetical protein